MHARVLAFGPPKHATRSHAHVLFRPSLSFAPRKTLLHEKYAPRTRAWKGTCASSPIVLWMHFPANLKRRIPLSRQQSPSLAPKVAIATHPPATVGGTPSQRQPSAPKGTRKVAIELRNFAETSLTEFFDRKELSDPRARLSAVRRSLLRAKALSKCVWGVMSIMMG